MKNDTALMYTCSLIEFIGRTAYLRRGDVVEKLGSDAVSRIYDYADVLHCDSIEHVADEYSSLSSIEPGDYDNVGACLYEVPSHWTIGQVFERLIIDVNDGQLLDTLHRVYTSWICDAISNYNSDFFYQSRDYLRECYLAGEVLSD